MSSSPTTPFRQIRASYNENTITVYQAYSSSIAIPAVEHQKLNASPDFKPTRMTWIKPSWTWMMYRSGYSFKDANQAHILAIKMTHDGFFELLRKAALTTHEDVHNVNKKTEGKMDRNGNRDIGDNVRVQWDPERTPALEKLPYRSIQIGISGAKTKSDWIERWIVEIEDVTEKARALKQILEENPNISIEDLLERELVPQERPFEVPQDISDILRMDVSSRVA